MELNWSTFLLEIFNFLILIWILKRFLYQPILDAIARRRASIENKIADAERLQAEAGALKERYEHRLTDWEQEHQKSIEKLRRELEDIRLEKMENLKVELALEEEKTQVIRARQDKQAMREIELRALQQSAEFASRLLGEASGPELEDRLFEILLKNLTELTSEQIDTLNSKWKEMPDSILVVSAYSLDENKRQQLEAALSKATGLSVPLNYEQDESLLAGLSIMIGDWALQLNVRDELVGFMDFANE